MAVAGSTRAPPACHGRIRGGLPKSFFDVALHSDTCHLAEGDSFCISRPVSLPDASEMLWESDVHQQLKTLIGQDPSLSCSEVWMGLRREDGLSPWARQQVVCSGEKTPTTKLDAGWHGRYPYNYEVEQIRRLSEGDMRGFAISGSWEVAVQGSVATSPGWSGEDALISRGAAIALSRDVLPENGHLQLRPGLSVGYTSRPSIDVDEHGAAGTSAVEGAHVAFASELRMHMGANFFATAVPSVGHVVSAGGSEGWTLDMAAGIGYQLTNRLSILLRAALVTVIPDGDLADGGTAELAWRL